jgi:hypothetical protein
MKSLPLPLVIGGLVVALLVAGTAIFFSTRPGEAVSAEVLAAQNRKGAASPFDIWAKERYQAVGGDWAKLSKEEQQRFNQAGQGQGETFFKSFANAR